MSTESTTIGRDATSVAGMLAPVDIAVKFRYQEVDSEEGSKRNHEIELEVRWLFEAS